jgi:hypothetical protein
LSSNADGCLANVLLADDVLVETGVVVSDTGVLDRATSAALDASMRGLSGGFDVIGVKTDPDVDRSERGDPLLSADLCDADDTLNLPKPFITLFSSQPSLPPPPSLDLARATILALILASRAANVAGSYPSHSFSCVAE